ncbi:unnamed protein product [Gadus morhua 'NCC']
MVFIRKMALLLLLAYISYELIKSQIHRPSSSDPPIVQEYDVPVFAKGKEEEEEEEETPGMWCCRPSSMLGGRWASPGPQA